MDWKESVQVEVMCYFRFINDLMIIDFYYDVASNVYRVLQVVIIYVCGLC